MQVITMKDIILLRLRICNFCFTQSFLHFLLFILVQFIMIWFRDAINEMIEEIEE